MNNFGKIVYVLLLIAAIFSFYKSFERSDSKVFSEIRENVVIVENGKLDKKNEGKLVLVSGKLTTDNVYDFEELNLSVNTPAIKLEVQEKIDGEWTKSDLSKEELTSAKIGDYIIPKELMKKSGDFPYFTDTIEGYTYDEDSGYYVKDDNNNLRLKYQHNRININYSVLGLQKGNEVVQYFAKHTNVPIYEIAAKKINTIEGLQRQLEHNKRNGIGFTGIVLAGLIFLGYQTFIAKKKEVKE